MAQADGLLGLYITLCYHRKCIENFFLYRITVRFILHITSKLKIETI